MDIKLDNLIEKIKKEGIDEAKKAADTIITEAQKSARSIIADAKKEADRIVHEAQANADKLLANAEAGIRQSARDTVLVTKENLTKLFDRVFKKTIADAMSPEFLKQLILEVVKHTTADTRYEFVVADKDIEKLRDLLLKATQESISRPASPSDWSGAGGPVVLKVDKGISSGFRVGLKDSNVYYDLTDESVANFLKEFLNPSISEILNKNNG